MHNFRKNISCRENKTEEKKKTLEFHFQSAILGASREMRRAETPVRREDTGQKGTLK